MFVSTTESAIEMDLHFKSAMKFRLIEKTCENWQLPRAIPSDGEWKNVFLSSTARSTSQKSRLSIVFLCLTLP